MADNETIITVAAHQRRVHRTLPADVNVREYRRLYYHANRERILAQKRERYRRKKAVDGGQNSPTNPERVEPHNTA